MLSFVKKYGYNITSQNGENGIIRECLNRINPALKIAIEFGAPDQMYCSNIYPLKQQGWDCYYYDDNTNDPYVTNKLITEENINDLPACSIISMDTDGMDYRLWEVYRGRPDIVVIEINSSLPPDHDYFSPDRGCSYQLMVKLAIKKGYFVLCHTGNIIALLHKYRELFPEVVSDGLVNFEEYFNTAWL
jgi:hypothetical protein